jgi:tRNA-splicing ligase RtcB
MAITGDTFIGWGFKPGSWFPEALAHAARLEASGRYQEWEIREFIRDNHEPKIVDMPTRTNSIPFGVFLDRVGDTEEMTNLDAVTRHMDALMRTPTLVAGAVMPDACPSGSALGTIPVGGVVAAKDAIHPGFHSADVCCSMAITVFKRDMAIGDVLDIAQKVTHFGPGGRTTKAPLPHSADLLKLVRRFDDNLFLKGLEAKALDHFTTQGDGNHFFYVGHLKSTGQLAIVTHHGSRGLGGELYKRGMAAAKRHTAIVSPRTPDHNAWLDTERQEGRDYWLALQMVREWTKLNHYQIHDGMQMLMGNAVVGRFWNEHNFVFRKTDGLYYHAKGATPNFPGFSDDDTGRTLIPMNMAEPILIAEHANFGGSLGFAPHGAGRNLSRTAHFAKLGAEFGADSRGLSPRDQQVVFDRETAGIDARFYTGKVDLSELPSAYKNAKTVLSQIERHGLATIVDKVLPGGSLMAGESSFDWRAQRAAKRASREATPET